MHELGHIFWIIIFKGRVEEIVLTPIGGLIKVKLTTNNKLKNLLIDMGRNYYKYRPCLNN